MVDVPDASKPPAVDMEALSKSLAKVCIEEKVYTVVEAPTGGETGSPAVQNSNTDLDASVDNQRWLFHVCWLVWLMTAQLF